MNIRRSLCQFVLLIAVALATLAVGGIVQHIAQAYCSPWYRCTITQTYQHNMEHGVDIATHGLVITALLAGTVTFDQTMPWDEDGVQDITWKLDSPQLAKGFKYAYVQILRGSTYVKVRDHLKVGTPLGLSGGFIEFGLTKSWAYGYAGDWSTDWTTDPRFLL